MTPGREENGITKESIIDIRHWEQYDYAQRITAAQWKWLLLNNDDHIIFKGVLTRIIGKRLGFGVIEISKEEKKEK